MSTSGSPYAVGLLAGLLAACAGSSTGHLERAPAQARRAARVALVGGTVVTSPDAAPIAGGVVVMAGDSIIAVGPKGEVEIPADAAVIDCTGGTVLAGFWNAHVHLGGLAWKAQSLGDERLGSILEQAFLRWGFVRVFELHTPSLATTRLIQERIETGEVDGPAILSTGSAFAPYRAPPWYTVIPAPDLSTPRLTRARVSARLDEAVDGIKLFTGSIAADGIHVMSVDLARVATEVAHDRGVPVFAHPTNSAGARVAIDAGVDILAHAFPHPDWDETLIAEMIEHHTALIPSLTVFARFGSIGYAVDQLRAFSAAGGDVIFGTDLGANDEDPRREYALMIEAGLDFADLLRSLTVTPARRFGRADVTGKLEPGMRADVVVVDGDPISDPTHLAAVRYAFRRGRLVHRGIAPPLTSDQRAELYSGPSLRVGAPTVPVDALDRSSIPLDSVDLTRYVGTYREGEAADGERVTITLDHGALKIEPASIATDHLVPLGNQVFAQGLYRDGKLMEIYWPAMRFVFELGDDGVAKGYELRNGDHVVARGARVK
jgi:imidazolonepropionase-like amidohydrolase